MTDRPPRVTTKQVYLAYLRGEATFEQVIQRATQNADAFWSRQTSHDAPRPDQPTA